jgi:hypothetical protein
MRPFPLSQCFNSKVEDYISQKIFKPGVLPVQKHSTTGGLIAQAKSPVVSEVLTKFSPRKQVIDTVPRYVPSGAAPSHQDPKAEDSFHNQSGR